MNVNGCDMLDNNESKVKENETSPYSCADRIIETIKKECKVVDEKYNIEVITVDTFEKLL